MCAGWSLNCAGTSVDARAGEDTEKLSNLIDSLKKVQSPLDVLNVKIINMAIPDLMHYVKENANPMENNYYKTLGLESNDSKSLQLESEAPSLAALKLKP